MSHLPVPQSSLASYVVEINKIPLLTAEEERSLAIAYRERGEIEAAHKLVTSNLRFVVKVAYEYAGYGIRLGDLIQEGNIGLMQAVKKFDPHKGYRLISYAVWWIRATIQSFILKSWSLVKIGTTQAQRKLFYKLRQAKRKLATYLPDGDGLNEETCHNLAKNLQVREEEVTEMEARLRARDASLDQPLSAENQTTRLDLVRASDNQEEQLLQAEEKRILTGAVQKALIGLNERERFIVENRLMADEPLTLQEVGNHYRISRERARQLEEVAKKKIRNLFSKSKLLTA